MAEQLQQEEYLIDDECSDEEEDGGKVRRSIPKFWEPMNAHQQHLFDNSKLFLKKILRKNKKPGGFEMKELFGMMTTYYKEFDLEKMGLVSFADFLFHCDHLFDLTYDYNERLYYFSPKVNTTADNSHPAYPLLVSQKIGSRKPVPSKSLVRCNIQSWLDDVLKCPNLEPIPLASKRLERNSLHHNSEKNGKSSSPIQLTEKEGKKEIKEPLAAISSATTSNSNPVALLAVASDPSSSQTVPDANIIKGKVKPLRKMYTVEEQPELSTINFQKQK